MFVQSHTDATLGYVDQLQDQAFDTLKGTHAAAAAAGAGAAAAGHAVPAAATVAGALAKSILQCAPLDQQVLTAWGVRKPYQQHNHSVMHVVIRPLQLQVYRESSCSQCRHHPKL